MVWNKNHTLAYTLIQPPQVHVSRAKPQTDMRWVSGTYKAEAYNVQQGNFQVTPDLSMQITVDETFDNDHRVVTQTTTSSHTVSKFTFSAADSGLHRLCFTPSGSAAVSLGGWFGGGAAGSMTGGVKLTLDMAIGETSKIESEDKGKIDSIVGKVKELNGRLADIRREQMFQRVSTYVLSQLHLYHGRMS